MTIRYGNYTLYKNYEVQLIEVRQEMPIPFTHFILKWGEDEFCPFSEFKKDEHGSKILILKKEEVENAYYVITKAKYKEEVFELEPFLGDKIHLHLSTKNLELGHKLGFYKFHDSHGKPYYLGEVKISDVEKVWEEIKESTYNLPLPPFA